MAFNIQDLTLSLDPSKGMASAAQQWQQMKAQREQLKLQREQFEETKRRNAEDAELRRMAEAGATERRRMEAEQARAEAQAQKDAELLKNKQEAYRKFSELNGDGDDEGARAMVPYMTSLGMSVSLRGEVNGLPSYEVLMDQPQPEAGPVVRGPFGATVPGKAAPPVAPEDETAEQSLGRMGGMGYPTDETGVLNEAPGISTGSAEGDTLAKVANELEGATIDEQVGEATGIDPDMAELGVSAADDPAGLPEGPNLAPSPEVGGGPTANAFAQALAAGQHARDTGAPLRQPDEPDYTGAVRRNVIDTGAIQAQTLARLDPLFQGVINARPEEYRDTAKQTIAGLRGSGLPLTEQIAAYDKLQGGPDELLKAEIESGAKARDREQVGRMDRSALFDRGTNYGKEAAEVYKLGDIVERRKSTAQALDVLTNPEPEDDYMAGAAVSRLMGEKGATTEGDIERALGTAAQSFLERVKSRLFREAIGGLSLRQRNALVGVLKKSQETDQQRANDFLQNIDDAMGNPSLDPESVEGMRQYRNLVIPRDMRDVYEGSRKKRIESDGGEPRPVGANTGGGGAIRDMVDEHASANDLDADSIYAMVGGESGGKADAANPNSSAKGLVQFLDSTAQEHGFESAAEFAAQPAEQQMPFVIEEFKKKGITKDSPPEDYALAIAAPAFVGKSQDRNAVVYPKGSKEHQVNRPWWPPGGGDITVGSIIDYYRKHGLPSSGAPQAETTDVSGMADDEAKVRALLGRK